MAKQEYWSSKEIRKIGIDCQYKIVFGERSNGKSYELKHNVITNAYKKGEEFIILRRQDIETKKEDLERYFEDTPVKKITKNEWHGVTKKGMTLHFFKVDEQGKRTLSKKIGYAMAVSKSGNYKSGAYPLVQTLIFEEFMSETGFYLANEVDKFVSIISTVFRRRLGDVWLIGNKISRVCPYFAEWGLSKIHTQKQGTIDIYTHETDQADENGNTIYFKIAVENCKNSGNNTSMIPKKHLSSVANGEWQTKTVPKLPYKIDDVAIRYKIFFEYNEFKFLINYCYKDNNDFLFIESIFKKRFTDKKIRLISNKSYPFPFYTKNFFALCKEEQYIFDFLGRKQVYYDSNLTGADFNICYKLLTK